MRDDTPDDLVHDLFADALFPEPPARARDRRLRGDHHRDASRRDRRVPPRALPAREHRGRGRGEPRARRCREDGRGAHCPARRPRDARARRTCRRRRARRAGRRLRTSARAGAPRARHPCARACRSRSVRARRRRPGARRRHELAALPGDPREARPRVFGVLVPQRVRRDRLARGVLPARRRSNVDEVLDVVYGELDRLVADGGVTEGELDGPRVT